MTDVCPVCFVELPLSELPCHVECHFIDEDEPQLVSSSAPNGAEGRQGATSSSTVDLSEEQNYPRETVLETVKCCVCDQLVHVAELDDHERSHR